MVTSTCTVLPLGWGRVSPVRAYESGPVMDRDGGGCVFLVEYEQAIVR